MSDPVIIIAALLMLQPADGPPDCVSPTLPERLFIAAPTRPPVPSCVNERTNRHTCSNRIINAYNAEIDAYDVAFNGYVAEINAYISRLNDYLTAASTYTQCEQRRVAPQALIVG
ncbi:MAG: hypothetical protein ACK4FB_05445 [Brevundimonas sp.]|uniref:hypothetical protein n=1 Tax=Brevundimonas sp. TaxID=1871086 RepID=UPI00391B1D28